MSYSYLLDNNIYKILAKSPDGIAIRKFNHTIKDAKLPTENVKLRMTPYSVMEAVGITITDPQITLPRDIAAWSVSEMFAYILTEAKNYYQSKINRRDFLYKAHIESEFIVSDEGKELANRCVYKPLSSPSFEENFSQYLAFDFAFKFSFSKELDFDLDDKFFVHTFFTDNTWIARLSKFRLTKKFWDKHLHQIKLANQTQLEVIEELNKSMRLKNFKDYLDCDIVHLVTVGDYLGDSFRPTIAFTCDDGQTIVNRVMAYKTHIETLKEGLDETLASLYSKTIEKWRQGILVFCNLDGSIKNFIDVKEIRPFM